MPDRYDPAAFEAKWRARWKEADLFQTREEKGRPKFYGLDFFPYPSGAGLSVGHCKNYIPTDVICRVRHMQGFNVLHPMGFDAFGLPAENEAIKRKKHPAEMIATYAATYQRQMDLVGISYDWSRSFSSSDPSYYRWTQWIFELLFKRGLAYRKMASVNWCETDKTVLADEEVVAGLCWRCNNPVEKRLIPQWFFKITDYAQRLIDDLDKVDWPEGIKHQQRNWIGRSDGAEFEWKVEVQESSNSSTDDIPSFKVFTTRVDTVFGATFCVLAPEHPLVAKLTKLADPEKREAIQEYVKAAKSLSDTARQAADRVKTGVFTGSYAINPFSKRRTPIWIADYVLMGYGTGAIMAVPAHDERDFEFATKFDIPIVQVIGNSEGTAELPFSSKDGILMNSADYDGLAVSEAQSKMVDWLERWGLGQAKVQYKLRDWLISRQRYWGCPIPVIHSAEGEVELVPDECLPVMLPDVESYEPSSDGSSPLSRIDEFINVTDSDGRLGKRETDTMGGFACSSWYFLRFCDPFNHESAWDKEKVDYWMPVDCYVGGAEHAVMHLLYARFWTKVLFDAGLVSVEEPFQTLHNQGQVLGRTPYRKPREGEKLEVGEDGVLVSLDEAAQMAPDDITWRWVRMSKSKGNVVTPDEAVADYGADALRVYELFVAPFESDVQWSNEGMNGAVRFLSKIFKLVAETADCYQPEWRNHIAFSEMGGVALDIRRATHRAIKKATEDVDRFAFNTYISALMIYVNTLGELRKQADAADGSVGLALSEAIESLILLIAPAAPHSADELWESLGKMGFTYHAEWPTFDASLTIEDMITVAVQVNGKLRDTLQAAAGTDQATLEDLAKGSSKVVAHLDGKTIRKVVYVADKLLNFVVD